MFFNIFNDNVFYEYKQFVKDFLKNKKLSDKTFLIENESKDFYEKLAIKIFKSEFKFINNINIKYNINLVKKISLNSKLSKIDYNIDNKIIKQRLINALIQGASFKINRIYHIIDEIKDKEKYNIYFNNIDYYFYINDNENIKKELQKKENYILGTSYVDFTDTGKPIFNVKATSFIILLHELTKCLYTYLSFNSYNNINEYYKITSKTDNILNEPEDIKFGNFLYTKTKEYLIDNYDNYYDADNNFFELFFVELCKIDDDNFIKIIDNILNKRKHYDIEYICRNVNQILKKYQYDINNL